MGGMKDGQQLVRCWPRDNLVPVTHYSQSDEGARRGIDEVGIAQTVNAGSRWIAVGFASDVTVSVVDVARQVSTAKT